MITHFLALSLLMAAPHFLATPGQAQSESSRPGDAPQSLARPTAGVSCSDLPTVADVFGHHMVLQRDVPVLLWGWAPPGMVIVARIAGQEVSTTAAPDRSWSVALGPLGASSEPNTLTVSNLEGTWETSFDDILVGEVWLASGQSNMGVTVSHSDLAHEPPEALDLPLIRERDVPPRVATEPQSDVRGEWRICTPETAPAFSAVALAFARSLAASQGVPVGIIHASHGGTVAEAFMSPESLQADPAFHPILETWERFAAEYPDSDEERQRVGEERRQEVIARGEVPPPWPLDPKPADHFHRASLLHHGMIHPLVPYTIRGVVWYQGEANGWRAHQYRSLFPALIADWRRQWDRPELPFLFVQVARFEADWLEDEVWAELREAQDYTWRTVPHTAMVTALDQGNPLDIHPPEKRVIGERLAAAAGDLVYGMKAEFSGPRFERLEAEGGTLRVHFSDAPGGLVCDGERLVGFAVTGADRRYLEARARIEGASVVVWSEAVPEPVAVRYAWANAPQISLYGDNGLPALPFRTDTWPGRTDGRVEPEAY